MTEKKAIVIGIDGAQLEKLDETPTPYLDSLNIIESFTGGIQGTETEQQTFSGPGWGSLLTGVWANKHGIVSNDDTLRAKPDYPSIFEYVHNDDPDNYIASVVNWGLINAYFEEDVNSIVDFELTAPEPTDDQLAQDNIIAQTVADLILKQGPDYTFVHLDNVDVVAHNFGFSPEYLEAITMADGHVGKIIDAVEEREAAYPDEDWLVIVTTDHGREPSEGFDHGGQTDSERTTFIASNKELDDSSVAPATDLVPTVLDHLDIEGGEFDGTSLLESQPEGASHLCRTFVLKL
ncbi:MAG: alkaline phosphatase family protein [Moorea sp. SIOASIH]|uniref:alkaline phosphatase family protein n=1 Tax=Moorena sp. SIOASIH TaxID=2607817 RepID=UPI0013BAA647|nr:alkaline phosphatase family protein [Moorena sp. SIOASIH]NEO40015.1 alkaline phosphatase family protein [Moorena sp. SIOASIH]